MGLVAKILLNFNAKHFLEVNTQKWCHHEWKIGFKKTQIANKKKILGFEPEIFQSMTKCTDNQVTYPSQIFLENYHSQHYITVVIFALLWYIYMLPTSHTAGHRAGPPTGRERTGQRRWLLWPPSPRPPPHWVGWTLGSGNHLHCLQSQRGINYFNYCIMEILKN